MMLIPDHPGKLGGVPLPHHTFPLPLMLFVLDLFTFVFMVNNELEWTTSLIGVSRGQQDSLHASNYRLFKCFLLLSCMSLLVSSLLFFFPLFYLHLISETILPFINDQWRVNNRYLLEFLFKNKDKRSQFQFLEIEYICHIGIGAMEKLASLTNFCVLLCFLF